MLRELVIARLRAQVPDLRRVGSALDLAGARAEIKGQYPCAFVMTVAEAGGPARYMTGRVAQKRTPRIAVVLMVRNMRDGTGLAASSDMDALRAQTDAALFGWLPDELHSPLVFSSGKLLGLLDNELWWQDEYTTEFDRR